MRRDDYRIERFVFDDAGAPGNDPSPSSSAADPYVCPVCRSPLVYPADWDRTGETAWVIDLRCPECETRREITLDRPGVEELNRRLYLGLQALAREAERMTRRNFEEEAAKFVAALARDLILPMDF
jgi:uncharacterized protein YbaR (Trm112 family)